MIFVFTLFVTATSLFASHQMPTWAAVVCFAGMVFGYWCGLSRGVCEAYDAMGRPTWVPPTRVEPTATRPQARILDEECD